MCMNHTNIKLVTYVIEMNIHSIHQYIRMYTNNKCLKIFEINKIKGLLKCFKCTQKKGKLDTITLPDSVGPFSRNILSLLL